MRGTWLLASLAVLIPLGCVTNQQDMVRDYNEDGLQLFRKGSYAEAADTFEAALRLKLGDESLLYNAGRCYERCGQPEKAENYYRAVLQQDAQNNE